MARFIHTYICVYTKGRASPRVSPNNLNQPSFTTMYTNAALTKGSHLFESDGIRDQLHHSRHGELNHLCPGCWVKGSASLLRNGFGRQLEKGCKLVYLIPRGNGKSGRPVNGAAMSSGILAKIWSNCYKQRGIEAMPVFVSHSNGACIILRYSECTISE